MGIVRQLRPTRQTMPEVETVEVHGYTRAFRRAGRGSAILLLHGIGDRSESWSPVLGALAEDHLVIAPDLLGHGASDKPRGDYSVGGFANGIRDLLTVLNVDRVTLIGHSLGAGVAMQFAYQYPERCERVVLVGAGGVSREVHPALRALTLPGSALVLGALRLPPVHAQVCAAIRLLRGFDAAMGLDAADVLRVVGGLPDATARAAFVRALRSVVDTRGQVVTMLDRSYLADGLPTMLVWGTRDAVIPVRHARIAQAALPGSRLELFPGAGHFPHRSDPERFLRVVRDFLATTEPASWSSQTWRELLRRGATGPRLPATPPATPELA